MWQRPKIEEKIKVRKGKRPNGPVDLHKKLLIRIKCQIIEDADRSVRSDKHPNENLG